MGDSAVTSNAESELRDLRARAYGPRSDIQEDPAALARLVELEDARMTAMSPDAAADAGHPVTPSADGRSRRRWRQMTRTLPGRILLIACSLVVAAAIVSAVTWSAAPRPEATLQATGSEVDDEMLRMISAWTEVNSSTLRGYEPYRGVERWVAENAAGFRCLLAMERSTSSMAGASCAPREADLFVDLLVWLPGDQLEYMEGLALGTVIRFHMHGDSVDAYLLIPPSEAAPSQGA